MRKDKQAIREIRGKSIKMNGYSDNVPLESCDKC